MEKDAFIGQGGEILKTTIAKLIQITLKQKLCRKTLAIVINFLIC